MHRFLMKYKITKYEKNIQKLGCEFSFNWKLFACEIPYLIHLKKQI